MKQIEQPRRGELLGATQRTVPEWLLFSGMLLGIVLFYRSGTLSFIIVGLALFGVLALVRPATALLFVPLSAPLYLIPVHVPLLRPSGLLFPLHEIILLVVFGATGASWLWNVVRGQRPFVPGRVDVRALAWHIAPLAVLVAVGVVGVWLALPDRSPDIEPKSAALRQLRWSIIEPLLFYALLRWHGASLRVALGAPLLTAFVVSGVGVALIGVLQLLGLDLVPLFGVKTTAPFTPQNLIDVGEVTRTTSVYGNPNNLGLLLGRVWPVAAMLGLAAWRFGGVRGRRRAWLFTFATLVCLAGIVVSYSRGAWIGVVAAALVLGWSVLHSRGGGVANTLRGPMASRIVALVAVVVVVAGLGFASRGGVGGGSSSVRLLFWREALEMIHDHPFGIGLDQFYYYHNPEFGFGKDYMDVSLRNSSEQYAAHPHNMLLDIWLQLGPFGLAAFGWLVWRMVRAALPALHAPTNAVALVTIGALGALVAALTHGMVDNFYFVPDLAYSFWLLYAFFEEHARQNAQAGVATPPKAPLVVQRRAR